MNWRKIFPCLLLCALMCSACGNGDRETGQSIPPEMTLQPEQTVGAIVTEPETEAPTQPDAQGTQPIVANAAVTGGELVYMLD